MPAALAGSANPTKIKSRRAVPALQGTLAVRGAANGLAPSRENCALHHSFTPRSAISLRPYPRRGNTMLLFIFGLVLGTCIGTIVAGLCRADVDHPTGEPHLPVPYKLRKMSLP